MVHWNNPRAFRYPREEDIITGNQNQQHARPRLAGSQRRRCRQTTSEWQGGDQTRAFQVYRFRSRAPSISVCYNGEGSLGLSRISGPREDGKIMEILARSASYWVQQEPARCWVRDCTGLACSAAGHSSRRRLSQHHLLGEEGNMTSLIREELLSMDEGNDGSIMDAGTASSQADAPSSFAEEYSLAPSNAQKKYSARSFDQQVKNYFKWL